MSNIDEEEIGTIATIEAYDLLDTVAHVNANDQRDMQRMGKKQEFSRSFHFVTSIAFTSCVMGTWELILTTSTPALVAGGTAGLFWSTIWGYIGQSFIVLSLAEMSSMAPTAGGQYHWVRICSHQDDTSTDLATGLRVCTPPASENPELCFGVAEHALLAGASDCQLLPLCAGCAGDDCLE